MNDNIERMTGDDLVRIEATASDSLVHDLATEALLLQEEKMELTTLIRTLDDAWEDYADSNGYPSDAICARLRAARAALTPVPHEGDD